MENTVIVFISDHGEHLGDHGVAAHDRPTFSSGIRVPLMFRFPGDAIKPQRIDTPVQLLDVAPTLLETMGIETGSLLLQGSSLVPLMRGENISAWDNHICHSEEVYHRKKTETFQWGSIYFRRWHVLHTEEFATNRPALLSLLPDYSHLRIFDYVNDQAEISFTHSLYFDLLLKRRIAAAIRDLRAQNMLIWEAFKHEKESVITVSPEAHQQLRDLGYL